MTEGATWTVKVTVERTGAGTTVELNGSNYKETLMGSGPSFTVEFTNVPDGEYDVQLQCGAAKKAGKVSVKGGNAETTIDMEL